MLVAGEPVARARGDVGEITRGWISRPVAAAALAERVIGKRDDD